MRLGRGAAFAILVLCAGVTARAEYAIRWISEPASTAVEVEGIPRDALAALATAEPGAVVWTQLLAVFAEQPVDPGAPLPPMPPMAGTWRIADGRLRFEPRFPFARGVAYRAEFWPARLPGRLGIPEQFFGPAQAAAPARPVISFFELPRDTTTPATAVLQIYPTTDVLPENQLKFYIHFSGPMSRGGSYEHVRLSDAQGATIALPFLELDEELWDPSMTRLTLLIDPGRIKRGVKPLEDIGPVFEAGKTYTLAVAATWRDAGGRPLRSNFQKTFRVGSADRTPPDPARWTLSYVPPAGSQGPLVVNFDEPLDRALALRLIGVRRVEPGGSRLLPVDGEVMLDEQERRWVLAPVGPWRPGAYRLIVGATIEDLAGNNIGKTFDVDLAAGAKRQLAQPSVMVPFEVK